MMEYVKKIREIIESIKDIFGLSKEKKSDGRSSGRQRQAPMQRRSKAVSSSDSKAGRLDNLGSQSISNDSDAATLPERAKVEHQEQLPLRYEDDVVILQVRDPWWIYSYWEVKDNTVGRLKQELGGEFNGAVWALRVYDISFINFDGTNAHKFFDINVNSPMSNWYINVSGGCSYVVDLGLKLRDGRFIVVVRSNSVTTPLDGPSNLIDEEWMIPDEDFARLYNVSLYGSSPQGKRMRKFGEFISSHGFPSSFRAKNKSP